MGILKRRRLLFGKSEAYRRNPWKEGESPMPKIRPKRSASWGV